MASESSEDEDDSRLCDAALSEIERGIDLIKHTFLYLHP